MINIKDVLCFQAKNIVDWHVTAPAVMEKALPWEFIEENNQYNFKLWHEEDIARVKDIDPLRIVEAKRNIDQYNQARNNAMEKIDEWILNFLATKGVIAKDKLHSETPGMMIDRLSIMQLKRFHMEEETLRTDVAEEHIAKCAVRVKVLDEQIGDLANCLQNLLAEIESGALQFKVYRQFKMYNDPSLNPELYKRENKS